MPERKHPPASKSHSPGSESEAPTWTPAHRDIVGQPLSNAELGDLRGNLLPVSGLGHPNGRQILLHTWHEHQGHPLLARPSSLPLLQYPPQVSSD